jgi:hypothetical protein
MLHFFFLFSFLIALVLARCTTAFSFHILVVVVVVIIIMVLQPFVEPWSLFQFLIVYTVDRIPWTGDQPVARPLPTHNNTSTE